MNNEIWASTTKIIQIKDSDENYHIPKINWKKLSDNLLDTHFKHDFLKIIELYFCIYFNVTYIMLCNLITTAILL